MAHVTPYGVAMTFSIVARSDDGESWGVAVASKFLAVGNAVPAAVAGLGAIATQAWANVSWKGEALALLDEGATAEVVVERLVADDEKPEHRQLGVVDLDGRSAAHTGRGCVSFAGHLTADGVAIQGNCLTGPEVLDAAMAAWTSSTAPFAHRLLAALEAADAAGGDMRGRQSAALLVVREGAGYDGADDVAADLRVDDHPAPIPELQRLLELNDFFLTASTEEEKVPVTDEVRADLEAAARAAGRDSIETWVGCENYEMRVADDLSWVDARVLEIARGR